MPLDVSILLLLQRSMEKTKLPFLLSSAKFYPCKIVSSLCRRSALCALLSDLIYRWVQLICCQTVAFLR